MSEFEALFAFYGLLLGLAIANVTTAFADMYRARATTRIGLTVPLLGLLVLLAATQQWTSLFGARDRTQLGVGVILTCLAMALPYIFVSRVMTPDERETTRDLERHYADNRIVLIAMLMAPLLTSAIYNIARVTLSQTWTLQAGLGMLSYNGLRLAVLAAMLLWPARWLQRTGLLALSAYTVFLMTA